LSQIYTQLKIFVQEQLCFNLISPTFQEPANFSKITALLTELQRIYKSEWSYWTSNMINMRKKLSPKRAAIIFTNRHRFLESANILNTIWLSLNRSQVQGANWTPASRPLLPIPFSINNPFGSYLWS